MKSFFSKKHADDRTDGRIMHDYERVKLNEAKAKIAAIAMEKCHSKTFLVVTISFTVMFLCQLVFTFINMANLVLNLITLAFMLFALIGFWMTYLSKKETLLPWGLNFCSLFEIYNYIVYMLIVFAITLLGIIVLGIGCIGSSFLELVSGSTDLEMAGLFITLLIGLAIFAVAGVIYLWASVYSSRTEYISGLIIGVQTGEFNIKKRYLAGGFIGSFLLGIFYLGTAGISFIFSSPAAILSALVEAVSLLSIIEKVQWINKIFNLIFSFFAGMGVVNICSAFYYICSYVWIIKVHKEIKAAKLYSVGEKVREENKIREKSFYDY